MYFLTIGTEYYCGTYTYQGNKFSAFNDKKFIDSTKIKSWKTKNAAERVKQHLQNSVQGDHEGIDIKIVYEE